MRINWTFLFASLLIFFSFDIKTTDSPGSRNSCLPHCLSKMHQSELETHGKNASMMSIISAFYFILFSCRYNHFRDIRGIYHLESKESMDANFDIWERTSEDAAPLLITGFDCWLTATLPMCDNQFESWLSSSSFA